MAPANLKIIVASSLEREVLTAEMWLNNELLGEIVPVGQSLHIVFYPRENGLFHELGLEDFEKLLQRAKKEALLNLEAALKSM